MTTYLAPVEKPKGLMLKLVYFFSKRQVGKVPTPIAVFSPRLPSSFLRFYGKVAKLDKKLQLPPETAILIREQVSGINSCTFCSDFARWYTMKVLPKNVARMNALPSYRTSPLFTEAERAALDYAAELTADKHVSEETFARLACHYDERQICEIIWLVASEHLYNITNHGLNIGSDGLCELSQKAS